MSTFPPGPTFTNAVVGRVALVVDAPSAGAGAAGAGKGAGKGADAASAAAPAAAASGSAAGSGGKKAAKGDVVMESDAVVTKALRQMVIGRPGGAGRRQHRQQRHVRGNASAACPTVLTM